MANSVVVPKSLIIFGICLPLAVVVGYLMATPFDPTSFATVGLLFVALSIPILMHWHYPLLILSWNALMTVFFLPGEPSLWMLMAGISLFFTVLARILNKEIRLQQVGTVTWSLIFLTLVILVTAKLTGGIGLRSMGGNIYGGRKFFWLLAAVIGYFAISSVRIPPEKAMRYAGLFFLSGISAAFGNLIYLGGENFYWLFYFFPIDFAFSQAIEDFHGGSGGVSLSRLSGFTFAGLAAVSYMLARDGIAGILNLTKPWRLLLFLSLLALSLLGGFRSIVALFILVFFIQFYFEGLFRTRLFLVLGLAAILGGAATLPFVSKLPLSIQRSLSFLPVEVHPAVRANTESSTEWRIEMWKVLLPTVPQYFWIGKGYAINPSDLYLAEEAAKRGLAKDYEMSLIAGDYHSGPLSVLIPFGIFGLLGFAAFLVAGGRVMYRNYRYGDPALHRINVFLLGYFIARVIFYLFLFGAFHSDLALFVGLIGLSIALNGGMSKPRPAGEQDLAKSEIQDFSTTPTPAD